jgi:hypothetical protein
MVTAATFRHHRALKVRNLIKIGRPGYGQRDPPETRDGADRLAGISEGQIRNKPIYVVIGVTAHGERDILGL